MYCILNAANRSHGMKTPHDSNRHHQMFIENKDTYQMIEREFNFLLEAWQFCYENGIPDWHERVKRVGWTTWKLTVPADLIRPTKNDTVQ